MCVAIGLVARRLNDDIPPLAALRYDGIEGSLKQGRPVVCPRAGTAAQVDDRGEILVAGHEIDVLQRGDVTVGIAKGFGIAVVDLVSGDDDEEFRLRRYPALEL